MKQESISIKRSVMSLSEIKLEKRLDFPTRRRMKERRVGMRTERRGKKRKPNSKIKVRWGNFAFSIYI